MNVLMIGSGQELADPSIKRGNAIERHIAYGKAFGKLHIIVYTPKKGLSVRKLSKNVWVYPTNSLLKSFFVCDAKKIGKKICKKKSIDVITTQDPFVFGYVGYKLSKKFSIPFNAQIHGEMINNKRWRGYSLFNCFLNVIGKQLVRKANSVRVVSSRIQDTIIDAGVKKGRIFNFPISSDLDIFSKATVTSQQKSKIRQEKDPVLIAVGRLVKEKDYLTMIDAFKQVIGKKSNAMLIIIGKGNLENKINAYIKENNLSGKVILAGEMPRTELTKYYKSADLLLFTSELEGWGMVVLEALASGLPVVMTDVGCSKDIIIQGKNGFVCKVKDADDIANNVIKSLDNISSFKKPFIDINKYTLANNVKEYKKMLDKTIRLTDKK